MLVELNKLSIVNEGHRRGITVNKIYVNPSHVISIVDYHGANSFLIREGAQELSNQKFSLVKMNNIKGIEEVIVLGRSEEIFEKFKSNKKNKKDILNG